MSIETSVGHASGGRHAAYRVCPKQVLTSALPPRTAQCWRPPSCTLSALSCWLGCHCTAITAESSPLSSATCSSGAFPPGSMRHSDPCRMPPAARQAAVLLPEEGFTCIDMPASGRRAMHHRPASSWHHVERPQYCRLNMQQHSVLILNAVHMVRQGYAQVVDKPRGFPNSRESLAVLLVREAAPCLLAYHLLRYMKQAVLPGPAWACTHHHCGRWPAGWRPAGAAPAAISPEDAHASPPPAAALCPPRTPAPGPACAHQTQA